MSEQSLEKKDEIYYIEAITEATTRIGGRSVMPNMPPLEFTEAQYKSNKRVIDHYEANGVIMVTLPGTRDAIMKAADIRADQARQSLLTANSSKTDTPDPVLRNRGFSAPEGTDTDEPAPEKMPKWIAPAPAPTPEDQTASDFLCVVIAKTTNTRCKHMALDSLLVCGLHNKSLKKGSVLKDASGRIIARDGKSFEPLL